MILLAQRLSYHLVNSQTSEALLSDETENRSDIDTK